MAAAASKPALIRTAAGFRLYLRVTPKARRNQIEGLAPDAEGQLHLKIKVTAAPEDGKANKAVIKLLAKTLKLPVSAFHLRQGETSRYKLLAIDLPDPAERDRLEHWHQDQSETT